MPIFKVKYWILDNWICLGKLSQFEEKPEDKCNKFVTSDV